MSELLADYIPDDDYARIRRVTTQALRRERRLKVGPPYVKVGRQIFYSISGHEKWLASRLQHAEPARSRRTPTRQNAPA